MKWALRAASPTGLSSWRMVRLSRIRRQRNSSPNPGAKKRHDSWIASSPISEGTEALFIDQPAQRAIRMKEMTSNALPTDRRGLLSAGAAGVAALLAASPTRGADTVEDTLDKIKNSGVFNLGVREAAQPYGFKNADGEYVGFSTEIGKAIMLRSIRNSAALSRRI